MEKHEKCEAKGRGASFGRVAGGLLRVPSLRYSHPGLLCKRSQFAEESHVGSVKCQANGARRRVLRVFPLQTSHFRLPTRLFPLALNRLADFDELSRGASVPTRRRPRSHRAKRSQSRGGRPYKQTQPVGELSRQTKPIARRLPGGRDIPVFQYTTVPSAFFARWGRLYKRSQFAPDEQGRPSSRPPARSQGSGQALGDAARRRGQVRQTKPIRGGRLYKQTQSVGELSRQTKPIGRWLLGSRDTPLFHYSIIPVFHHSIGRLRLPGACRTNEPNWRGTRR
jgi:hypothetical protein